MLLDSLESVSLSSVRQVLQETMRRILVITNRQLAERLAEALERIPIADLRVRSWSRYGD